VVWPGGQLSPPPPRRYRSSRKPATSTSRRPPPSSAPTGREGATMSVINRPARVGLVTDQTGPLSFMGIANANVAKMVVDDINERGGLLGRPVELFVEDSAPAAHVARAAAARLVDADVDVVIGGIFSSTRQAIKGPVVDGAGKLYI